MTNDGHAQKADADWLLAADVASCASLLPDGAVDRVLLTRVLGIADKFDSALASERAASALAAAERVGVARRSGERWIVASAASTGIAAQRAADLRAAVESTVAEALGRVDGADAVLAAERLASRADAGPVILEAIGQHLLETGSADAAGPCLRRAYDARRRECGDDAEATVMARGNLASALLSSGDVATGAAMLEETLELQRRIGVLAPAATVALMVNLAQAYHLQGDEHASIALALEAVALIRERLGDEHPYLQDAFECAFEAAEALPRRPGHSVAAGTSALWRAYDDCARAMLGPEDPAPLKASHRLGAALIAEEAVDEAAEVLRPVAALAERTLGREDPTTVLLRGNLAVAEAARGQLEVAIAIQRELADLARRTDADGPDAIAASRALAHWLMRAGASGGPATYSRTCSSAAVARSASWMPTRLPCARPSSTSSRWPMNRRAWPGCGWKRWTRTGASRAMITPTGERRWSKPPGRPPCPATLRRRCGSSKGCATASGPRERPGRTQWCGARCPRARSHRRCDGTGSRSATGARISGKASSFSALELSRSHCCAPRSACAGERPSPRQIS